MGYYWRPDEGINVTGGAPPVSAFTKDGRLVEGGLFQKDEMRDNIWLGTRGDYIAVDFEVQNAELRKLDDGNYLLSLTDTSNQKTEVTLPPDLVFDERNENWELTGTGNKTVSIIDKSGPDLITVVTPQGDTNLAIRDYGYNNDILKSPLKP